jgi:hypothetical protein
VVTLEPTLFLEINSAALDLSSDEVRERFNKVLLVKVLNRLREANKALAKLGQAAVQGSATAAAPGSDVTRSSCCETARPMTLRACQLLTTSGRLLAPG